MHKRELLDALSAKTAIEQKDLDTFLSTFEQTVVDTLRNGDHVKLLGFGTFSTKFRPEREGRDPRTGDSLLIPAHTAAIFKPGSRMKEPFAVRSYTLRSRRSLIILAAAFLIFCAVFFTSLLMPEKPEPVAQTDVPAISVPDAAPVVAPVVKPEKPVLFNPLADLPIIDEYQIRSALAGNTYYITVNFDFDSPAMGKHPANRMEDVTSALNKVASHITSIRIDGHTDSKGSEQYNEALSFKRAEAAAAVLEFAPALKGRVNSINAFGETEPLAPNDTEDGRAKNRRVEIAVTF